MPVVVQVVERPVSVPLLAALPFLGLFSLTLYQPALPALVAALGTTPGAAQLTVTVYLAAFGAGQLTGGPLSDRFGRRPTILAGYAVFALASLAAALAPSIELLLAARAIQGFGAAMGTVVGRAIVRDTASGREAARTMAVMSAIQATAPMTGLFVGGLAVEFLGWRTSFALLGAAGLGLLLWVATTLAETNSGRAANTARGVTGMARDLLSVLGDRVFTGYVIAAAGVAAAAFLWQVGSPYLFQIRLGYSPAAFGLLGLVPGAGYVGGSLIARQVAGAAAPASIVVAGSGVACLACLLFVGLAASGIIAALPILGAVGFFGIGLGIVLPTAAAAGLDRHPGRAGSASAALGVAQMLLGAAMTMLLAAIDAQSPAVLALLMTAAAAGGAAGARLARPAAAGRLEGQTTGV
jgi:DHA1 family bicyclomycin/chloramphenicol resistance-like MFS transporter